MMDQASNNGLMSENTGHGDNALLDTGNTGKSIKLYLGQFLGVNQNMSLNKMIPTSRFLRRCMVADHRPLAICCSN